MTKEIGLWIDHKKAVIVVLSEQGEKIHQIESGVGKHVHYRGATRPKTAYSAQYQQGDDQLDKQFTERLNKFYGRVIAFLREADAALIFGPGEAKYELEKRLAREKMRVHIAGLKSADKMTDRQIVAKVRNYFKSLEPVA